MIMVMTKTVCTMFVLCGDKFRCIPVFILTQNLMQYQFKTIFND